MSEHDSPSQIGVESPASNPQPPQSLRSLAIAHEHHTLPKDFVNDQHASERRRSAVSARRRPDESKSCEAERGDMKDESRCQHTHSPTTICEPTHSPTSICDHESTHFQSPQALRSLAHEQSTLSTESINTSDISCLGNRSQRVGGHGGDYDNGNHDHSTNNSNSNVDNTVKAAFHPSQNASYFPASIFVTHTEKDPRSNVMSSRVTPCGFTLEARDSHTKSALRDKVASVDATADNNHNSSEETRLSNKPKRRYTCNIKGCHFTTTKRIDLLSHNELAHGKTYRCQHELCSHVATTAAALYVHVRCRHKSSVRRCRKPGCHFQARNYADVTAHMHAEHGGAFHYCDRPGCNGAFATRVLLTKHRREMHKELYSRVGTFPCDYAGCDFVAARKSCLVRHRNAEHLQIRFQCTHPGCTLTFKQKGNMKTHYERMHVGTTYACSVPGCIFVGKHKTSLASHMRSKHEKVRHHCEHPGCSFSAVQKATVAIHVETAHVNKTYACGHPGCSYVANCKEYMKRHRAKMHSNAPLFHCPYPGCTYVSRRGHGNRVHYESQHEGKRYACGHDMCTYSATQKGHLKTHWRTQHGGERPPTPVRAATTGNECVGVDGVSMNESE